MLYQLSYEAADVGCRSIVGSYVPVKEMSVDDIWNKSYMNCGNEMKMKKWSSQWTQFMLLRLLDKDLVGRILHEKIVPQEISGQYLRYKWPGLGWIHRIKGFELTCAIEQTYYKDDSTWLNEVTGPGDEDEQGRVAQITAQSLKLTWLTW